MISNRTMACLFEIISDIDVANTISLLQSIDAEVSNIQPYYAPTPQYKKELYNILIGLDAVGRTYACSAVAGLRKTLRTLTNPEFKFDERWTRFERSLRLDGYNISEGTIISEDPIAEQLINTEDSLTALIHEAGIHNAGDIAKLIENSSEDFIKQPPDYNGSISNIRTAMEELAKFFAASEQARLEEQKDTSTWVNSLSYLRAKDFLSEKEEKTLASIYSLLSELHRPIRISEEEMIRFARALALSECWLLAKKGTTLKA